MSRRSISLPGLGHGSQPIPTAAVVRGLLVTGGISGRDPGTGEVPPEPAAEVRQAFANLRAVLHAADADPGDVAKVTVFTQDRELRTYVNQEWLALFPDPDSRPARHTLLLPPAAGLRLQLECLAVTGS